MFSLTQQGAVDVVSGDDPLTSDYIDDVQLLVERCFHHGQPRIVMDLRGVSLIDSAGLELLLDVRERCAASGGLMHLAAANALCRDILNATGVASQFDLFDSAVEAAGSFAR